MEDTTSLFTGLIFGSIGVGYLYYGVKQHKGVALFCGFILCAVPYVITNLLFMLPLSAAAMALPFFYKN